MLKNRILVMAHLTSLIGKLVLVLLAAVALGSLGYLCATFLLIFGAHALLSATGADISVSITALFAAFFACAFARGFLRYFEQLAGHYMAFKLLAVLRDRVFSVLRKLAPARLEQRDQGELVSAVTNDIELLEVFYAHTLAPVAIAAIVSALMSLFIGAQHFALGIVAALGYACVGIVLPMINSKARAAKGGAYKEKFDKANSFMLESLGGLSETLRFGHGEDRKREMERTTDDMEEAQRLLKRAESRNAALTDAVILFFSGAVLFAGLWFFDNGAMAFSQVLIAVIAMMSSFGPVVALSSLSNDLTYTVAAGERILSLLAEQPETPEVKTGVLTNYSGAECENVGFSYDGKNVLQDICLNIPETGIVGICGESGSGKTTLLKLLMRFWDVGSGNITISGKDIRSVNTRCLREIEGYVTQDAFLFEGTLLDNIRLSKPGVTMDDVQNAAERAGIHEFILSLPKGYDTPLGELGEGLSAGERQRIGLARAFLHGAPLLLLDEPTSNLDGLNEAIILKSLREISVKKSILLVSHRESTLNIADWKYQMNAGRMS